MASLTHPSHDLNTLVNDFNSDLREILEQHAPTGSRTKKTRPLNPWFDDEVLIAKKERRRLERIWIKTRLQSDKDNFRSSSNSYITILDRKKTAYYSEKIRNYGSNQKSLFAIVNDIRRKVNQQDLPDYTSEKTLANDFAGFF